MWHYVKNVLFFGIVGAGIILLYLILLMHIAELVLGPSDSGDRLLLLLIKSQSFCLLFSTLYVFRFKQSTVRTILFH